MLPRRPTLLMVTAAVLTSSIIANGVAMVAAATAPPTVAAPPTRLGVAITEDVTARDGAALGRKRALDLREQAALATEERLKAELAARERQTAKPAEEAGDQFEALARIYQAMKPAKAAIVFEQLDLDVQMQVAGRMRDRATALILAAMTPRAAADLSMALARKSAARREARPAVVVAPVTVPVVANAPAGAPAAKAGPVTARGK
jgi:flagellar motility protein MotE (MotC chaperone)